MSPEREILSYRRYLSQQLFTRVTIVRDLGIYFDTGLSFSYHVTQRVASSVRMLGLLSRLSYYLTDLLCIIRLFSCLVRTHKA